MSKKIKENTTITTTTTDEVTIDLTPKTTVSLEEMMTKYPNVSLRKLSITLDVSYGWILKCSKKPIPGKTYDPDDVNYDEVQKTLERRGIDLETVDWETLNEATQTTRGINLQKDMSSFEVGTKVYLREDNEVPFVVAYKTETHIVIMKEGSTEPRAWSHSTFLMKGPVFEPRTIKNNEEEVEA